MSETFHRNGIPTERVLAVLTLSNGFAITVRAARNLIRPSHFFVWLKQNNLERLRGVTDLYIERETANAEEEGVEFVWLAAPKGFTGDGSVSGVIVSKMRLGAPDASGRQSPEEIPGADYTEEADLVIKALGFEPEEIQTLWDTPELQVTRWGTVKADFTTKETSMAGVYAAGDIVRGASLVVWAIRDGRDAADSILAQLNASAAIAAE